MKKIILFIFFGCACCYLTAQPIRFMRTYGFSNHDELRSKQTADNGYILYGEKNSLQATADILIIKTDSAGTVKWAKTFGTVDADEVWGLEIIKDGYLVSAQTGNPHTSRYLMKIDSLGNLIWVKTNFFAECMVPTPDGGLVFTTPYPANFITRVDSNYNVVWRKKYVIPGLQSTSSLRRSNHGNFLISGNIAGYNNSTDYCLMKTDSLGNILWVKRYGGNNYDSYPDVQPTFDGGCVMFGTTESFGVGNGDALMIKTDSSGNIQWSKTYGGTLADGGTFVKPTFGSIGYILTGNTQGFIPADTGCTFCSTISFVIKTDINGNFQWARRYGIGPQDNAVNIFQTQDGGYSLSGSTAAWGAGGLEGWLIKTDNMGLSGCNDYATTPTVTSPTVMDTNVIFFESNDTLNIGTGTLFDRLVTPYITIECLSGPAGTGIKEIVANDKINVFPNPSDGIFNIECEEEIKMISVNDVLGRINTVKNDPGKKIDLSFLPPGFYFLNISTKEGISVKKIIKD